MAHTAIAMTSLGLEVCDGCSRPFRRGERMNGMEYEDGESAGWHCDDCVKTWQTSGETALPRWSKPTQEPRGTTPAVLI